MTTEKKGKSFSIGAFLGEYGILLALLGLWVVMGLTNKHFLTVNNLFSISREASFVGIAAIGMTFVIMTKGIDLSIPAILSLCSVVASLIVDLLGIPLTIITVVVLGGLCGLINGLFIVGVRIPPFITTLGTFYVFRAIAYILTGGGTIKITNSTYTQIGGGALFSGRGFAGIPYPFFVLLICLVIGTILLKRTSFGRSILAIGNSENASRVAGIDIKRTKVMAYTILGICSAICAILLSARLHSARAEMSANYAFAVITIVVMGGCALAGGRGNIVSTGISALFFVSISNAMNNYNVDPFWQYVINGIILLFAFSMYNIKDMIAASIEQRRKKREYASANTESP